jgi:hypothetical protein
VAIEVESISGQFFAGGRDKQKESGNSRLEKNEGKSLLIKILVVSLPSALKN